MASNYYDEELRRHLQQAEPYKLNSVFQDPKFQFPQEVISELNSRIPDPYGNIPQPGTSTPEIPGSEINASAIPEIDASALPDPTFQAPAIEPLPFDVEKSADTVTMDGRPESLPSQIPGDPLPESQRLWELEEDIAPAPESTLPVDSSIDSPVGRSDLQDPRATEDAALLATGEDNDKARRDAELERIRKQRLYNKIPQTVAGIGDAISAGASAFGANVPSDSQERLIARQDKQLADRTANIDVELRNDATSDTSKQYQNLLAQMMQKDPSDTAILGLTANQIAEKIPAVERMMQRRADEDLKRLTMEAAASKAKGQTTAQKAVDKKFGTDYAEYVAGGGYADTMTQISALEGVLTQLQEKGGSNLTGGGLSLLPDAIRKRTFSDSMAAQQTVEQSVQRTLKKTLGGQFTEKEGILFMQRGYDPALDEKDNAEKLERTINQLKLMALAKQEAIDYYEQNDTLDGFKGTFYTLKDGQMVKATKDDFLQMMRMSPVGTGTETPSGPRKTKSNYSYTVD